MNVVLIVLVAAAAMLFVELFLPARRSPASPAWIARALSLNALQAATAYLGAISWDRWFSVVPPLIELDSALPVQVAAGYGLVTFVYYWWHRARHQVPLLWRWLHRLHHSPSRLEIITSFYKHPLELLANGLLSSALLWLVLGLPAKAVALTVLATGLAELFYHWNVRTPRWLGWFFQRPEMHRVHHQRGVHSSNFSDLPLWDLLFGTFNNPHHDDVVCGFAEEQRLGALLVGRPVREC